MEAAAAVLEPEDLAIIRATTRIPFEPWRLATDRDAHAKKGCGGPEKCPGCRLSWALHDAQKMACGAMNFSLRACWRADTDAYDKFMLEYGRAPKGKDEWPSAHLYTYPLVRKAFPALASATAAMIARRAERKWSQVRFDVMVRQIASPPHFRATMPLPLRAQATRLSKMTADDGAVTFWLSFSLHPGRHDGGSEFRVPIVPRDGRQKRDLESIASGFWKMGDLVVEQDRRRKSRWYLRIAYTRKVPVSSETRVAAINRGMCAFIAAVTNDGDTWIYDGTDIMAYLAQVQRRRREYQRQVRASARVGHGRKRTLRPIEHLSGKAERWRETKCQTIARQLAKWMADRKIGLVIIEDFEGIRDAPAELLQGNNKEWIWERIQEWPYYQLQMRLVSCLEELGIATKVRPAHKISQTCPVCGHVSVGNMDLRHRMFRCEKCEWKRHLDVTAGMNLLDREQSSDGGEPAPKSLKKSSGPRGQAGTARKPPRNGAKSGGGEPSGGNE